ncbi:conserved hypothetical protein [Aspergillus fumigatus A1163]|uniref:Aminoglycoside phosphotransferase domain-containing protein n=1 Tax=Aspergillus fumigatus (strain CBS 144.89 / FGSC A1163 / CEA10) TaxID=451804 RepID=B0Y0E0_ASPFC|nr:conserved hypothetical protein [Aspergillus fumigatus A1163]
MGEAEAMCLVRNTTSVPVPEVLNAYMIDDIGFILMRKIPGVPLEACWESLFEDFQQCILERLRASVHKWRRIEGTFFGSVDQGPCEDTIFKHPWGEKNYHYGPFQSRKEFSKVWIIDWGAAGFSIAAREYFGLVWATPDSSWRRRASTILPSDEYNFGQSQAHGCGFQTPIQSFPQSFASSSAVIPTLLFLL